MAASVGMVLPPPVPSPIPTLGAVKRAVSAAAAQRPSSASASAADHRGALSTKREPELHLLVYKTATTASPQPSPAAATPAIALPQWEPITVEGASPAVAKLVPSAAHSLLSGSTTGLLGGNTSVRASGSLAPSPIHAISSRKSPRLDATQLATAGSAAGDVGGVGSPIPSPKTLQGRRRKSLIRLMGMTTGDIAMLGSVDALVDKVRDGGCDLSKVIAGTDADSVCFTTADSAGAFSPDDTWRRSGVGTAPPADADLSELQSRLPVAAATSIDGVLAAAATPCEAVTTLIGAASRAVCEAADAVHRVLQTLTTQRQCSELQQIVRSLDLVAAQPLAQSRVIVTQFIDAAIKAESQGRSKADRSAALMRVEMSTLKERLKGTQAALKTFGIVPTVGGVPVPDAGPLCVVTCDYPQIAEVWSRSPSIGRMSANVFSSAVRQLAMELRGFECVSEGYGSTLLFPTVLSGLDFAAALQSNLLRSPWPEALLEMPEFQPDARMVWRGPRIRVAIDFGEVTLEGDPDTGGVLAFGPPVKASSIMCGLTLPGFISVTGRVTGDMATRHDGMLLLTSAQAATFSATGRPASVLWPSTSTETAVADSCGVPTRLSLDSGGESFQLLTPVALKDRLIQLRPDVRCLTPLPAVLSATGAKHVALSPAELWSSEATSLASRVVAWEAESRRALLLADHLRGKPMADAVASRRGSTIGSGGGEAPPDAIDDPSDFGGGDGRRRSSASSRGQRHSVVIVVRVPELHDIYVASSPDVCLGCRTSLETALKKDLASSGGSIVAAGVDAFVLLFQEVVSVPSIVRWAAAFLRAALKIMWSAAVLNVPACSIVYADGKVLYQGPRCQVAIHAIEEASMEQQACWAELTHPAGGHGRGGRRLEPQCAGHGSPLSAEPRWGSGSDAADRDHRPALRHHRRCRVHGARGPRRHRVISSGLPRTHVHAARWVGDAARVSIRGAGGVRCQISSYRQGHSLRRSRDRWQAVVRGGCSRHDGVPTWWE